MKSFVFTLAALMSLNCFSSQLRETQMADLEFAKTGYVMKSLAFSPENREKALTYIENAKRLAGTYSEAGFLAAILKVSAFADNGHDYFNNGKGWWPSDCLPFHMVWFSDGIVVTRAGNDQADLLGARVTSIEGLAPEQLLVRLRNFFGGPDAYVRWNSNWAIESGGILHALGIARVKDKLHIDLVLPNGQKIARDISFVPRSTIPPQTTRAQMFQGKPYAKELEFGWRSAVSSASDPFYLQEPQKMFRVAHLTDLDALYVQFRTHQSSDADPIEPFIQRVTEEISNKSPQRLILDMRFDSGGNSDHTVDLMRVIAKSIPGNIYIMISPYTFSAGIVTTAVLRKAAGARVILVGDEVGDRLRWWSEGDDVCLPNSLYCLHVTTGLWDLEKGCAGEFSCYGDQFNCTVGSLAPELKAPITSAAWLAGRDPGLEVIKRDLQK